MARRLDLPAERAAPPLLDPPRLLLRLTAALLPRLPLVLPRPFLLELRLEPRQAGCPPRCSTQRRISLDRESASWADFLRPGGKEWYDWQMKQLEGFEVLLSIWHTPPSISEGNSCSSPPKRLRDYADFIDVVINEYHDQFSALELWNEPNNKLKWNFEQFDPHWSKFAQMIGDATYWAKQRGVTTVLGGIIPVDHHWLNLMQWHGVLEYVDVVAIHAFPGMYWPGQPNWDWHEKWNGWNEKISYIQQHTNGKPVWVTETGIATWDLALKRISKYELQVKMLEDVINSNVDRFYWYSLIDLDPNRDAIEGFHVDENEYHMGLIRHDGTPKHAFYRLKELLSDKPTHTKLARV